MLPCLTSDTCSLPWNSPNSLYVSTFVLNLSYDTEMWSGLLSLCSVCVWVWMYVGVYVLVAQSHPTLCDPMDSSPPGFSVDFSRQQYWSESPVPSPRDLPHPGSNPGRPHCRQILYRLSHQGSPRNVIPSLAASASPKSLLEMQNLCSTLELLYQNLCFNKNSREFECILNLRRPAINHQLCPYWFS